MLGESANTDQEYEPERTHWESEGYEQASECRVDSRHGLCGRNGRVVVEIGMIAFKRLSLILCSALAFCICSDILYACIKIVTASGRVAIIL